MSNYLIYRFGDEVRENGEDTRRYADSARAIANVPIEGQQIDLNNKQKTLNCPLQSGY
ncbi:hypothetical protein [Oscillatoria sp. FACHB-1406]|uniref:hypothetical protein n=1 Tax=Oscillatoria sp. FACHB-1406 TaxID=2692846 RepID=UPI001683FF6F|nr:hypothetical protein [Oscillatoria sp. FACHB-1406]MBD2579129.1 hypothetical protein [Oscillatoria sp. FACHB-1406]